MYSIELAQVNFYGVNYPSNITFGSENDADYVNQTSLTVQANILNYSYPLSNFTFGRVYKDDSGADESEFFYEMKQGHPVTFAVNFMGLGLPADLYS